MKKLSKRMLGAFLAAVMMVTMLPNGVFRVSAAAAAQNTYATGDIIEFGSYPQTKVTDESLITALNACTLAADNTVEYGGVKYQQVHFAQYITYTGGTSTNPADTYQDNNGYNMDTVYWFRYEPIKWRILSNTDGELFVLADKILDAKAYNGVRIAVTWETCNIRTWLNNDFINVAFSSAQRSIIKTSTVIQETSPSTGHSGGNNTNDKLFMLSLSEVYKTEYGFGPSSSGDSASRRAQGTDFSKSKGLDVSTSGIYAGSSDWWLRMAGGDYAGTVIDMGYAYNYFANVNYGYIGARPAFRIDLSSITSQLTFNSAGGSAVESISGIVGSALTAPANPTKAGYTFVGWDPVLPATFPEDGLAVTATWAANTYTVAYDANGGTGTTASSLHTYDTAQVLTANGYTKSGYAFEYWNTAADGSGTMYSDGQSVTNLTAEQGATVTLYAQWNEYSYTVTDSKVTITKYSGVGGAVTIPETLGGYPVTEIGFRAFYTSNVWTSVTIPDCVITISDSAFFSCRKLTTVAIGSGVTFISSSAFYGCDKLEQITVNPANTAYSSLDGVLFNFEKTALVKCPETKSGHYAVPDSVLSIDDYAFYSCVKLTSVTIPDSVLSIGVYAFRGCTLLASLTIGNNVASIGRAAFSYCKLTSVMIPAAVTTIDNSAFSDNWYLTAAYFFGDAPTSMGDYVFEYCAAGFTVYYLSDNTTFYDQWYGYTTATFLLNNTITFDANGGIGGGDQTVTFGTIPIAPAVTRAGYTFEGWLPAIVPVTAAATYSAQWTAIDYTITFDSAGGSLVTDIVGNAGEPVTVPSDPTRTGYTFTGWSPALPATFPAGGLVVVATWIANTYNVTYAANGGTGTTASSLHTYDTPQPLTANGFTKTGFGFERWNTEADGSGTAYSDSQSVMNLTAVQGATINLYAQWNEYSYTISDSKATITKYNGLGGAVTIPETLGGYPVTAIGSRAFFSCYTLTSLTIPDGVETIADDSFFDCGELTGVSIGIGATYISSWAFVSCGKLTQFNVNPTNTVYASEDGVLLDDAKTTVIIYPNGKPGAYTVPASVTAIGAYAFYRCSALTSITLPAGLTLIGAAAFDSCYGLQNVIIPAGVSAIGDQAFWFSGNLAGVYFLGGAPAFMGNMVFDFCAANFKVYYLSEHTEFAGSWYGYPTEVFAPASFGIRDGATTVIDQNNGFIYGLATGVTQESFESDFVNAGGTSKLIYTSSSGSFGTGTKVELIDTITNNVLYTYTIVIFGDVNGDGSVDSLDAGVIVDCENYMVNFDPQTDAAYLKAGDINGDGSIDSLDAGKVVDCENYIITIDQSTGLAG